MPGGSLTCCCFSGPEPPGPARSHSMFNLQSIRNENESFDRNRRQSLSAGGFCRRRPCGRVRANPFRGLPFSRTFSASYPLGRGEGPRARSLCPLHAEPNRKFRLPRSPLGAWADPFAVRQRDRYVRKHGEQGKIALSGAGRGLPDVPPSGGRAAAAVSPAVKQIRTIPHSECGD